MGMRKSGYSYGSRSPIVPRWTSKSRAPSAGYEYRSSARHASSSGRADSRAPALEGSRRQARTGSESRNIAAREWKSTRSWSTSSPAEPRRSGYWKA